MRIIFRYLIKLVFSIAGLFFVLSCSTLSFEAEALEDCRYPERRKIIVTADDFGASENINEGIIRGIDCGFINTVSAMVTFPGADASIRKLSQDYPETNIGLHLSITSGFPVEGADLCPSLLDENGRFYTIDQLILRLDRVDLSELESELRAQIELIRAQGVRIDHLSSQHNILHLYSPFTEIVMKLAAEYGLPMRSTRAASVVLPEFAYSKTRSRGLDLAGALVAGNPFSAMGFLKYTRADEMEKNQQLMNRHGLAHPAYLIDSFWGEPTAENLYYILTHLPPGVSEIVFHLGVNDHEYPVPPGIEGDYFLMRELELMSLNNREIERWMADLNIVKTDFSHL